MFVLRVFGETSVFRGICEMVGGKKTKQLFPAANNYIYDLAVIGLF